MIWLRRLIALLIILAIWQIAVWLELAPERYLPAPARVAEAVTAMFTSAEDMRAESLTLLRALAGFALTVPLGIALGILGALFPPFQKMLRPWTELLRPIPPAAIIPISMFAVGLASSFICSSSSLPRSGRSISTRSPRSRGQMTCFCGRAALSAVTNRR